MRKGTKMSEEQKRKISIANKEYRKTHIQTRKHCVKCGCFIGGKEHICNPSQRKGKYHTEESKRKMSIANKRSPLCKNWLKKLHKQSKGKHYSISTEFKKGEHIGTNHHNWKNGTTKHEGYMFIYSPNHPHARSNRYVKQSHLVAEKCLRRYLDIEEKVHHIDLDCSNDIPKNLFIFENNSAHTTFHLYLRYNPILKDFLESNLF